MEVDSQPVNQPNNHDDHYLVLHNKMLKCVCQLCTCGKHQCPRPRIKGNFSTSYADHYKDIKIAPSNVPRLEYKYEQRHYNPNALKTNYQQTYVPQPINNYVDSPSKLESYGSKILYQVPFVGQTSYKDQYKPYVIKPVQNPEDDNIFKSNSPAQLYRPTVKFDGTTSYKTQFVEPPKVQSRPVPQPSYQRAQVPFYGSSSYKNDFPEYKIQQKPLMDQMMSPNYRAPQVKFQGTTSYNDEFKPFQVKNMQGDLSQSRNMCVVQKLHVPPVNYVNEKNHIYYDPDEKKFV